MRSSHLNRLYVHIAAILTAGAAWFVVADFTVALALSVAAFLAVNAIGNRAFGPLAGRDALRRDIETMLRDRDAEH